MPRPLFLAVFTGAALALAAWSLRTPANSTVADLDVAGLHSGMLYGRVTTTEGEVHEGHLRWGGDEEALWTQHFFGKRSGNPWADRVDADLLPTERVGARVLGFDLLARDLPLTTDRPFQARFGEIERITADGRSLRVTLRGGHVADLDRWGADDFADGLRVWTADGRVVDLGEREVRSVEFLSAPTASAPAPLPLYGTVETSGGTFSGPMQWNREAGLATDALPGGVVLGTLARLDRIDATRARGTLRDGGEVDVTAADGRSLANRGLYVDDRRFGQVLVPWDAVRTIRFTPSGPGPGRDAFAEPVALFARVSTTDGRTAVGRIVFDLDESLTTETLDAPADGIDYLLPFGSLAAISVPADLEEPVGVVLVNGETLELERRGDLGETNLGMLVFESPDERPVYLPWPSVRRIEFDASLGGAR